MSYLVQWYEPITVAGEVRPTGPGKWQPVFDGARVVGWKRYTHKGATFPSRDGAEQYKRDVETTMARGERIARPADLAVATVGMIYDWYKDAAGNDRTCRWRASMLRTFLDWTGRDRPVSDLSGALLERFAATLPSAGRQASTRHRKVLAVEAMWAAAREPRNRDRFPGVPDVQRVTALSAGDVNAPVQAPPAVVRTAVPTVEDVDAMRMALRYGWRHGDAHARVALLCRYTGLRISQAVNLHWRDVFLIDGRAGPYIVLRAGTRGAKKGRTRVVPLHPALVEEMAGWGVREGRVFASDNERWTRGEATRDAFRTAWMASGVDTAKWDMPDVDAEEEGGRGHGSPTHAIRAAVFTALLREGVSIDVAGYLIGHATTATRAAYVPEASPDTSPRWPVLRDAVAKIPDHREGSNVIRLSEAKGAG